MQLLQIRSFNRKLVSEFAVDEVRRERDNSIGDAAGSGVGDGAAEPAVTTEVEAPKQEEAKPPAEPDLSEFDLDELPDDKNWRELSSWLNNVPTSASRARTPCASPDRLTTSLEVRVMRVTRERDTRRPPRSLP